VACYLSTSPVLQRCGLLPKYVSSITAMWPVTYARLQYYSDVACYLSTSPVLQRCGLLPTYVSSITAMWPVT